MRRGSENACGCSGNERQPEFPERLANDARVEIGIGINTGPACVGNVGSAQRFNYSAIGDAVNIAARAESACKELAYDLVICKSTADQAPGFAFLEAGSVQLKGKSDRIPMMALVGDESVKTSPEFKEMELHYQTLIASFKLSNEPLTNEALQNCRRLAESFDSNLVSFVERVPERREDFGTATEIRPKLVAAD